MSCSALENNGTCWIKMPWDGTSCGSGKVSVLVQYKKTGLKHFTYILYTFFSYNDKIAHIRFVVNMLLVGNTK